MDNYVTAGIPDDFFICGDVMELLNRHYDAHTPIAIVQKATWPDQEVVMGTVAAIVEKVRDNDIRKTALILVADFPGNDFDLSKLYDKNFSHEFRSAQ